MIKTHRFGMPLGMDIQVWDKNWGCIKNELLASMVGRGMFTFLFLYWARPGSHHVTGPSIILWAFSDSCTNINPSQAQEWRIIVLFCVVGPNHLGGPCAEVALLQQTPNHRQEAAHWLLARVPYDTIPYHSIMTPRESNHVCCYCGIMSLA
jgi:hypothetical protein